MTTGQAVIAFTVTIQVFNLAAVLGIWRHIKRIADAAERAHPPVHPEFEDTPSWVHGFESIPYGSRRN